MLEWLTAAGPSLREFTPLLVTLVLAALVLGIARTLLQVRERRRGAPLPFGGALTMLGLTTLAVVAIVLALPVGDTMRGQLLSLLGLVLTGIIAFSSTTFVANAMAGLMLRAVGNFRPGDWLRVGDQFGRVTERGLFHTEIQTEDRDLATLPNLYLVTNPVVVVRESGTIVSATLSLGYDRDHAAIEALLLRAAEAAELSDSFVQLLDLGDFSVTYRVAGFLPEVRHLLSARSRLRASVLDTLHGAGVEIVSPTFMNQRRLGDADRTLPARAHPAPAPVETTAPEELMFDKAEERASIEALRTEQERLLTEIAALESGDGPGASEDARTVEAKLSRLRTRAKALEAEIQRAPSEDEPR